MELPTLDRFPHRVLRKLDIETVFAASRVIVAAERPQLRPHGRTETKKPMRVHTACCLRPSTNSCFRSKVRKGRRSQ